MFGVTYLLLFVFVTSSPPNIGRLQRTISSARFGTRPRSVACGPTTQRSSLLFRSLKAQLALDAEDVVVFEWLEKAIEARQRATGACSVGESRLERPRQFRAVVNFCR